MTKEGPITAADEVQPITAAEADDAVRPKKKRLRLALMLSVPLLILLVGGYFWLTSGRYVSTDNAYVQQDKVSVSAEVTGPILEVMVRENQRVKRGDLLFRIDPRPYRIALQQAEAQIAAAQVSVGKLEAEAAGTGADIQGASSNVTFAQRAFERQAELMRRGFTTRARYDEALHGVQEAKERLANARAEASIKQAALAQGPRGPSPRSRRSPPLMRPATRRCSISSARRCARRSRAMSARPSGCRSAPPSSPASRW
jgi:membrane fusion protein (multidrug efflux system)